MKKLLIDFSSILYTTFYSLQKEESIHNEESFANLWRHYIYIAILDRKNLINPDEVILCCDSKSWRYDVYPYYKAKRELTKSENILETDFLKKWSQIFIQELKENFPFVVLEVYGAEGDDIIGCLCHTLKNDELIIVSKDKDFGQLLINKNVKFLKYPDNKFIEIDDPKLYLLHHILKGDVGDGIPNLLSQDNCFVAGIRQKGCGEKKIDEILTFGLDEYIEKHNLEKNYERNKKLIELNENSIPENVWNDIIYKYENYKKIKYNYTELSSFFYEKKMNIMFERITEIKC